MAFTNSKLVDYTKISPNSTNPRKDKIRKITIHHVAGNLTVEQIGNIFVPKSRKASANYGIDNSGRVGMYVEEKNRAWTSSNANNDNQAITIEVANSKVGGDWPISDKALEKLIDLCVDICKRNKIKKLNYTGDKNGNLTRHNMFAATLCPGPYLQSKFPYIVKEVNKRLGGVQQMVLRKGDKGNEVKKLQQDLISLGYNFGSYGADGSYGGATETTVKQFQKDNKLAVDGISGPATQSKIQELLASKTTASPKNDYLTRAEFKKIMQDFANRI